MTDARLDAALARAAERIAGYKDYPVTPLEQSGLDALAGWAAAIQALRSHGAEVEDRGWHVRECVLAVDWSHYQIESPCSCEIERKALASFVKAVLGGDDAVEA